MIWLFGYLVIWVLGLGLGIGIGLGLGHQRARLSPGTG